MLSPMYLPTHFNVDSPELVKAYVDAHPLALLVCTGDDGLPCANHVPLRLFESATGVATAPPSWRLEGHLARANPQIEQLRRIRQALVIFGGPGAYVSPSLYDAAKAVPTWNYIAVHLSVEVALVEAEADKDALLKRLIGVHEPAYAARWRALPADYQHSMLGAIVGVQLSVTRVEAKFKLSQNRPEADRQRVHDAHASGAPAQQEMAQWMQRLGAAS
jgi:transcriptional regulator